MTLYLIQVMLKHHLNLVRIQYQNCSFLSLKLNEKGTTKTNLIFACTLPSNILQNSMKKRSKMLDRNCANWPWGRLLLPTASLSTTHCIIRLQYFQLAPASAPITPVASTKRMTLLLVALVFSFTCNQNRSLNLSQPYPKTAFKVTMHVATV